MREGGPIIPSTAPRPYAGREDRALLLRMRARDETALEALYDRYGGLVYTLALRIVGDRELASEVLQDTFLRCWRRVEQYDASRGRVAAWLMGVARNRAIDVLRSRQHRSRSEHGAATLPGDPGEPAQPDASDAVALRHAVTSALEALPSSQREVIELAYYGGLTHTEIAERVGAPLGTIKTRMRAGLERLGHLLAPLMETGPEASDVYD